MAYVGSAEIGSTSVIAIFHQLTISLNFRVTDKPLANSYRPFMEASYFPKPHLDIFYGK